MLLLMISVLGACSVSKQQPVSQQTSLSIQGKMYAAFFQQHAAEYRALCYQAFNFARIKVDQLKPSNRRLAIITDVDETLLDNAPYAVHQTISGIDHTNVEWVKWTGMAQCDTIPGAVSFLKYAAGKGIEVFYLTNRTEEEKQGTLANLAKFGFPNVDEQHLLLKRGESKEARRIQVQSTHEVVLMMGDNLSDFTNLFDKQTTDKRRANTDKVSDLFGNRFIVLPNTTYGDWESAIFRQNYNLTISQRDSIIRRSLKGY